MIFHRAFAGRRGRQGASRDARPRFRRLAALFGLSVLLGGLALPAVSLVLAAEPAPFCCSKGRCCCGDEAAARDERTCLKRGCGCDHRSEAADGEPLRIEAVLSALAPIVVAPPAEVRWDPPDERAIAQAAQPGVPPPRRSLPA